MSLVSYEGTLGHRQTMCTEGEPSEHAGGRRPGMQLPEACTQRPGSDAPSRPQKEPPANTLDFWLQPTHLCILSTLVLVICYVGPWTLIPVFQMRTQAQLVRGDTVRYPARWSRDHSLRHWPQTEDELGGTQAAAQLPGAPLLAPSHVPPQEMLGSRLGLRQLTAQPLRQSGVFHRHRTRCLKKESWELSF